PPRLPPVPNGAPEVEGSTETGKTLTGSTGTWTSDGPITFAFQWERCPAAGPPCAEIEGATAQAYLVSPHDLRATLRLRVTATNANGSASASSAPTSIVFVAVPANIERPQVSGATRVGGRLRASVGGWTNTPTAYVYQWQRCDRTGTRCKRIRGAGRSTYALTTRDRRTRMRVVVTAANLGGSSTATSPATRLVYRAWGKVESNP
ncbi:MAG: hypothetical protein ABR583_00630, partial [Gaiellaceae bacterium]